MKIVVTGKNITISEKIQEAIEKKFDKFGKYFTDDVKANVVIHPERDKVKMETTIVAKGTIFRAENVSYMFYNNTVMESTPSNWLQSYIFVPNSAYCYTGCVNIKLIDGIEGGIDDIPSEWGGYERQNTSITGETLVIEKTLEREIEKFIASGQSFHNIAPLVGQTPTITANESSQNIGQGLSSDILLNDGKAPYGELEGLTLVNLASERRSGELTTKKEKDRVSNVLPTTFKLDESKEMPVVRLEGSTLHNVANQDSKTALQTNGNYGTFEIDENIDETTHIKDGKMYSTTLYGQTISNDIAKPIIRHELNEYEPNKLITQHNDKEVIYEYGNFENATLKGKTLVNVVTEDSKDDDYVSFDEDISGQYITIEDSKYGSIKNATMQGETLINIVQEPSETEYVITGDAFEEQSGTLENTVEGNIKSAILKGQTLINLVIDSTSVKVVGNSVSSGAIYKLQNLDNTKDYAIAFDITDSVQGDYGNSAYVSVTIQNWNAGSSVSLSNGRKVVKFRGDLIGSSFEGVCFYFISNLYNSGVRAKVSNIVVCEWVDGVNDIPYFEGMQSVNTYPNQTVKKITWSSGRYYTETGTLTSVNATANHKYFEEYFDVLPNHTLRVIGNNTTKYLNFYDESKTFISRATLTSTDDLVATVPSNAKYYRYSMLVNSGMTDETVIYDEDMQINIADTSIEADYLQKMGVLQTNGKNLMPIMDINNPDDLFSWNYNASEPILYDQDNDGFYSPTSRGLFLNLEKDKTYTLSLDVKYRKSGYGCITYFNTGYSEDFARTDSITYIRKSYTFTTSEGKTTTDFVFHNGIYFKNIQLEEGSTATTYEPYKTNILSVNEEVKLRRIGDIKDELNLLTGELTQRIDEVVLDGSEDWLLYASKNDICCYHYYTDNKYLMNNYREYFVTSTLSSISKYANYYPLNTWDNNMIGTFGSYHSADKRGIAIFSDVIGIDNFKQWLSTNPIEIQLVLKTKSVKTVGLSILDQDDKPTDNLHTFDTTTHISTYAQGGGLIPFVNIPENISYDTGSMLKPDTTYTLQINRKESDYPFVAIVGDKEIEVQGNKAVLTTSSTIDDTDIKFYGKNNIIGKVQLIEGDHSNIVIPYFEGMQSIKMPVLTTTGKNLFDGNVLESYGVISSGKIVPSELWDLSDFICIDAERKYYLKNIRSASDNFG